jgi:hypothetical protein
VLTQLSLGRGKGPSRKSRKAIPKIIPKNQEYYVWDCFVWEKFIAPEFVRGQRLKSQRKEKKR